MKKFIQNSLLIIVAALLLGGCKEDQYGNYVGGEVSAYLPILDLRDLYKGSDVTLDKDVLRGSTSISGVVVSDYTGNNFSDALNGLLIVQDKKRLNSLRGIALSVGDEAKKYLTGDSVHINLEGSVLTQKAGMLQLLNVAPSAIIKMMSNKPIASNGVPASFILADPKKYESTLVSIVEGTYNPVLAPTDVLSGDKTLNDGFDNIKLVTLSTAVFANNIPPYSANYKGVVINTLAGGVYTPQIRPRIAKDITPLSSVNIVPDFVITGWNNDPRGTDSNNEYMQFRATRDINFAATPFSVVTTNNAGASTPTTYPVTGWALGGLRTYKFNLTSGTVKKGDFFYVGGSKKLINSTSSTSISSAKWIRSFDISAVDGDGFGTKTANLLANSGNAYGIAVFKGTTVNVNSVPIDVIFVGAGGLLFTAGPPATGFKIGKTDLYNPINPLAEDPASEVANQPFYRQGSNTINFVYWPTSDAGQFNQVNGVFDTILGKWTKARVQKFILLEKTSTLTEIETEESTQIK